MTDGLIILLASESPAHVRLQATAWGVGPQGGAPAMGTTHWPLTLGAHH